MRACGRGVKRSEEPSVIVLHGACKKMREPYDRMGRELRTCDLEASDWNNKLVHEPSKNRTAAFEHTSQQSGM